MRRIAPLLALVAVAALGCGGDSAPVSSDTPAPTASRPAALTPAVTWVPTGPARLDEAELLQAVEACLPEGEVSAGDAASGLPDCLASDDYEVVARPAEGAVPVVLIDVRAGCFDSASFIAWSSDGWHVQSAEPFLDTDAGSLINGATVSAGERARSVAEGVEINLGIIQANAECGSGAPQERYILMSLGDDAWELVWDSRSDSRTAFGHTTMEFVSEGIDTLLVAGDSWFHDDGKNVFGESNAGPHRFFEQTWVRRGQTYELAEESVMPSTYNTLVEFVYALGIGDTAAAALLVTDQNLVQQVIEAGLVRDPAGPLWGGRCGDSAPQAPPPCAIQTPDGRSFTVDMVASEESWLISAVALASPSPTPVR